MSMNLTNIPAQTNLIKVGIEVMCMSKDILIDTVFLVFISIFTTLNVLRNATLMFFALLFFICSVIGFAFM